VDPFPVKSSKIHRSFQEEKTYHGVEAGEDHGVFDMRDGNTVSDTGRT